ncbi:hypothetical protein B0J11DRAFT_62613 [Dendryphion nanum]|uniref:Uncharacterized protein n=1 Tax=Dendryphion nanum TaxID=256645 RepID=A0A9P9DLE2_9PLEO|nr:hypothetical protein B0J11DRAFT_62613 [Dendryphion nanum]
MGNSKSPKCPIRRIIGERITKRSKQEVKEYLIQWDPEWTTLSTYKLTSKNAHILEWQRCKAHKNRDGNPDKVFEYKDEILLRDRVGSENDHMKKQRVMMDTVIEMVKKTMGVWFQHNRKGNAIQHTDEEETVIRNKWMDMLGIDTWAFSNGAQCDRAQSLYDQKYHHSPNIHASDILQDAVDEMRDMLVEGKNPLCEKMTYDTIRVAFTGQIDDRIKGPADITKCRFRTVQSHLRPLFSPLWSNLNAADLSIENLDDAMKNAKDTKVQLQSLILGAPYLLRNYWIMWLARLFFSSQKLKEVLVGGGTRIGRGWGDYSRDVMAAVYGREGGDTRAPHDVQETYMCLRDTCHILAGEGRVGSEDDKGDRGVEEEVDTDAVVYEGEGEGDQGEEEGKENRDGEEGSGEWEDVDTDMGNEQFVEEGGEEKTGNKSREQNKGEKTRKQKKGKKRNDRTEDE